MKPDHQSIEASASKADTIFFDALEFNDTTERETFVTQACKGDEALQQKVTALIASLSEADNFFEHHLPLLITAEDLYETISGMPEIS